MELEPLHLWLQALRGLSPDEAADASLPAPLHSAAWAKRLLNTQLASWAELRHDTILYAKQSVTASILCEFPDAYVDPYPAFFEAMERLAATGRQLVETLEAAPAPHRRWQDYFAHLGQTMARLRALAERERTNEPMTSADLDFINHMVSLDGKSEGCAFVVEPEGWYADLFLNRDDILRHEPVIADVHTQPTDEAGNLVGRVLHVGTGTPNMFVVTLRHDQGAHPTTYRGFVSRYAERITSDFERLTDEKWRNDVATQPPPPPPWLAPMVAP